MDREADFDRITKGVKVHRLEMAFGSLTPGLDWRGSGRPRLRDAYLGRVAYCPYGGSITPESLQQAVTAYTA